MNILGKRSLSGILTVIINIIWWIEWVAYASVTGAIIIAFITNRHVNLKVPVTFSSIVIKQIHRTGQNNSPGQLEVLSGEYLFGIRMNLLTTLILLAGFTITFLLIILVTRHLKIIFSNLKKNFPFNEVNAWRIRNIGIIFIIASLLQWIFNIALTRFLLSDFNWGNEIDLTYRFNVSFMITGIILIIIAEIVKQGTSLNEENNLTI